MGVTYNVIIEDFAQRHFIKSFAKKYKSAWDVALRALLAELARIDNLQKTDKAEIIVDDVGFKLIKVNFKIPGRDMSAKSSGNRVIVQLDKLDRMVKILLVYGKTDLGSGNETNEWKRIIKNNYTHLSDI